MIGNFNEILSSEVKFGGNQINLNKALEFKECINNCNFGFELCWSKVYLDQQKTCYKPYP